MLCQMTAGAYSWGEEQPHQAEVLEPVLVMILSQLLIVETAEVVLQRQAASLVVVAFSLATVGDLLALPAPLTTLIPEEDEHRTSLALLLTPQQLSHPLSGIDLLLHSLSCIRREDH